MTGPDSHTAASSAPVLTWGPYTYWAASYRDNRIAFCIVAADSSGRAVGHFEKKGARYLWQAAMDSAAAVRFTGQDNRSVVVELSELKAKGAAARA
jgi:hypothetical protein